MKKSLLAICIVALVIGFADIAHCADTAGQKKASPAVTAPVKKPMPPVKSNMLFLTGTISNIDTTIPDNTKIELLSDSDGKSHVVELNRTTNIVKVMNASELKTGEKVKVMARKLDDKAVAMSIITGKIEELPRPKQPSPMQPVPPAGVLKQPQREVKK